MDKINIVNLEVYARHGVLPEERERDQKYLISAALYTELRRAAVSDELGDTLDYGKICGVMKGFAQDNSFNLIETLADRLAEKLLLENTALQKVWIEVKKPQAPIDANLETVSVEVERGRHTAYISLGSNIGDKEGYLRFALKELEKSRNCRVIRVSGFIETAPYGNVDQEDFLNACAIMETLLTPDELLDLLHDIEKQAGRERGEHWGPRTLDLDIVFYDDFIVSLPELRIPHPDMHKRNFVLGPLCEIAPYALHPVFNKTVQELLDELKMEN